MVTHYNGRNNENNPSLEHDRDLSRYGSIRTGTKGLINRIRLFPISKRVQDRLVAIDRSVWVAPPLSYHGRKGYLVLKPLFNITYSDT